MNATPIVSSAPLAAEPAQASGTNSAESPQASGGGHDFAAALSNVGPKSGRKSALAKAHGDAQPGGQLPGPGNFPPPPANAMAAPTLSSAAVAAQAAQAAQAPQSAQAAATAAAAAASTETRAAAANADAAKNAAAVGIGTSVGAQTQSAAPLPGDDTPDSAGAAALGAAAAPGLAAAFTQALGLPAAAEAGASSGNGGSMAVPPAAASALGKPVQDSIKGDARDSAGTALAARVGTTPTAGAISRPSGTTATAASTSAASGFGSSADEGASVNAGPPASDADTRTATAVAMSAAANGAMAAAANAADSASAPADASAIQALGNAAQPAGGPAGSAARPTAAVALAAATAAATAAAAKPAATPAAVTALADKDASDKHAGGDSPASATPDGAAGMMQLSVNSPSSTDTTPAPTLKVAAGVDTPEFGQGLADRVSYMVGNNLNGAKLQVNPPQLGPIEVRIAVQGDHAQVWMTSHSAVTRDALESSSPKLREMLGAQGFGQVSVDISQRSFQERPSQAQSYDWTPSANPGISVATVSAAPSPARDARGAVDAYA